MTSLASGKLGAGEAPLQPKVRATRSKGPIASSRRNLVDNNMVGGWMWSMFDCRLSHSHSEIPNGRAEPVVPKANAVAVTTPNRELD